jgi:hypothetical protein
VVRAVGGQQAAATIARINHHSAYGRYGRPQDPEHMPIDVAVDLDAQAGDAPVLHAMAQALGYVVFPKPRADADPTWIAHMGRLAQEAGEAVAGIAEALADDGKIDPAEVRALDLRGRVASAMEALGQVDAALAQIEADGEEAAHGHRHRPHIVAKGRTKYKTPGAGPPRGRRCPGGDGCPRRGRA